MRKQEGLFRMLKWIAIAPGISVDSLAILLDITDRGIYRWIAELKKAGAPIIGKKKFEGLRLETESFRVYGILFDPALIGAIDLRRNGDGEAVDAGPEIDLVG